MENMYLYGFSMFAGNDKVVRYQQSDFGFSVGDLLKSGDEYFLVLGEEVAFAEQYQSVFPFGRSLELVYHTLLTKKTLQLLHWMVAEYYTVYRNVMKYFLPDDIDQLLHRIVRKSSQKFEISSLPCFPSFVEKGQILVVFPDLWTMSMMVDESFRSQQGVVTLHSSDSQAKKDKAFWSVKMGSIRLVLTTHAELFQDYKDLKQIVFVDPHKWYYANQQDPRYKTPDVVAKLAQIWGIEFMQI